MHASVNVSFYVDIVRPGQQYYHPSHFHFGGDRIGARHNRLQIFYVMLSKGRMELNGSFSFLSKSNPIAHLPPNRCLEKLLAGDPMANCRDYGGKTEGSHKSFDDCMMHELSGAIRDKYGCLVPMFARQV